MTDNKGWSILHEVVRIGDFELIESVLSKKPNVWLCTNTGW
jgi:hypothetical protein